MSQTKKLLSSSIIIFAGTTVGSIFSYLFNMLMGRQLGPTLYGELTALMSFLAIASVAGGAILTIVMRYAGETYAVRHYQALKKLFLVFSKYVLTFALILFAISLAFLHPITNFLSIDNVLPVIIGLTSIVFSFIILVNKGILQGTQQFVALSAIGLIEMVLRLCIGLLLVRLGYQLTGAVGGIVLATMIAYFLSFWPLKRLFGVKTDDQSHEDFVFDKKEIIKYSLPATLTTLILSVALNADVIIVKHFFPADAAGMYAAISTIAKIILYITAPVISVMFPMISESKAKGESHYKLFFFSLALTFIGGLLVLAIYFIAPAFVIKTLYGSAYISFASYLPEVGAMFLFYTLINLICNYYLAIRKFTFIYYCSIILIIQIVVTFLFHDSLLDVIKIFLGGQATLFFVLLATYLFERKDRIREMVAAK
ncbi:MAG: oligosaccharide flippase family protein [bacterium]